MASQQHMEEIDEDDTSTSSSDNEDNGELNDAAPSAQGDDDNDDDDDDDDNDDDLDDSDDDLDDSGSDNDDEKDGDDDKDDKDEDDDDDDEDDSDDDDDDDDEDNDDDDDDGTSSEPEEEDKAALPLTLPPPPADLSAVSRGPAKMRIKLSLRLPTSANKAKLSGTTGAATATSTSTSTSTSASPMDTKIDASMQPSSLKKKVRTKPSTSGTDDDDDDDDDKAEAQATVVDSDDAGEEDDAVAVADVVPEPTPTTTATYTSTTSTSAATTVKTETVSSSVTATATAAPTTTKRRAPNPSRQIRFPPIGSPGLLMPVSSTTPREAITMTSNNKNISSGNSAAANAAGEKSSGSIQNMNGFIATNSLFQYTVQQAGYTVQNRKERPHRGSSVQRVVGDMFDSDVKLTLHFPELVPRDLLPKVRPEKAAVALALAADDDDKDKDDKKDKDDDAMDDANKDKDDVIVKEEKVKETPMDMEEEEEDTPSDSKLNLPQLLISKLESAVRKSRAQNGITSNGVLLSENGSSSNSNHTNGSPSRKKRRRRPWQFSDMVPVSLTIPYPESYIRKRIEYVKQIEARERAIVAYQQAEEEAYMARFRNETANGTSHAPPSVESIPPIPEPPTPPRIEEFKGHRDAEFKAKYADHYPYYLPKGKEGFVSHLDKECFHVTEGRYFGLHSNFIADPNFVGPNAPGIAGVNASGGAGLATSTAGGGSNTAGFSLTSLNATYQSANSAAGNHNHASTGTALKKEVGNASKSVSAKSLEPEKVESAKITKNSGPKPTSTSAGLRNIMEKGGTVAEALKTGIIRAAVHASRSGRHGQSFRAPNGETYPDVSKAFAAYAGIKPCERCKNNKQGVSE